MWRNVHADHRDVIGESAVLLGACLGVIDEFLDELRAGQLGQRLATSAGLFAQSFVPVRNVPRKAVGEHSNPCPRELIVSPAIPGRPGPADPRGSIRARPPAGAASRMAGAHGGEPPLSGSRAT
jgi:hypothetical protein